ncbi:MAG: YheT family hydrolase [Chthoniobacterales bacterium]
MPLIESSTYAAPRWLRGGHLQTIFPALFRRVPWVTRERERIEIFDGDFLDLDWERSRRADRVAILSHGLEGNSRDTYIQGMAAALVRADWDVVAWNCRGCSGEPNRLLRSYHSGATEDLAAVVEHVLREGRYRRAALVGFSLGGNIALKYAGDLGAAIDARVDRAVAFSVPCDLASSSIALERRMNRIYMDRFMVNLRAKIRAKMRMFPGALSDDELDTMRTFREFDGAYTAPLHGYRDAEDYWMRASSRPVLGRIAIPALLVNARNDPFLPRECFPEDEARTSGHFHLEVPRDGGHIGFASFRDSGRYWSENRAVDFLR